MQIKRLLDQTEKVIIFLFFFLFPIVFSPLLPNFFTNPKFILLALTAALMLIIKAIRVIVEKKLSFHSSRFDTALFIFTLIYLVSVIFVSPNKIGALLDPVRGALLLVLFLVLLFALPKNRKIALYASGAALLTMFLVSLGAYFSMFSSVPEPWSFMNIKTFNLMGNLLSQTLYAGFFLALSLETLGRPKKRELGNASQVAATPVKTNKEKPLSSGLLNSIFLISLVTVVISAFVLIREVKPRFMPFTEAWQISVDVLKTGRTALFGVGPGNYLAIYTRSKPISINNIDYLWNANVEFSRSAALQIFTEVGVLGVIALGLIFIHLFNKARQKKAYLSFAVLLLWTIFFPLTQTYFFVLFLAIYLAREAREVRKFDLKELDLFAYAYAGALTILAIVFLFLFSRAVRSDYVLAQSFKAAQQNQAQQVYDLQRQAIQLNPYNENARISFAQTNLLLADNLARKKKLSDQERQTISTLIQQSIDSAKNLVALNPQKAAYWANLAEVYRRILGVAEGSTEWSISSYQRAIAFDPRNPVYYFNLGSVYYGIGNYDEAIRFFGQAISLKSDIANYYYNLAWAYYQNENYLRAVNALEVAIRLSEPGTNDYKKAQKELKKFKASLPAATETVGEEEVLEPESLFQPTPVPTGGPQIKLPKDNAPPEITITPEPTKKP